MIYRLLHRLLLTMFLKRLSLLEGLEHLPPSGGFVIAANHIDYLDGFFLAAAIGRDGPRMLKFLSETRNYWWADGATIPVDPNNKAAALDRALAAIQAGSIICLFVEGQRNPTPRLLPGKTGAARLALKTGCPVIPLGISGLSARNFLQSVIWTFTGRSRVALRIGQPIVLPNVDADTITKPQLVSLTRTIMEGVARVAGKAPPDPSRPQQ